MKKVILSVILATLSLASIMAIPFLIPVAYTLHALSVPVALLVSAYVVAYKN